MKIASTELKAQFAELFAALDARPRPLAFRVFAPGVTLDLVKGEPVFRDAEGGETAANFRGRYLAEHEVPLSLDTLWNFKMIPTTGNRVKVRARKSLWR